MQQYHFNQLENRKCKPKKGQNVNKFAEETAVELYSEMSMDAKLTVKYITQQVSAPMAGKKELYEKRNKKLEKCGKYRV